MRLRAEEVFTSLHVHVVVGLARKIRFGRVEGGSIESDDKANRWQIDVSSRIKVKGAETETHGTSTMRLALLGTRVVEPSFAGASGLPTNSPNYAHINDSSCDECHSTVWIYIRSHGAYCDLPASRVSPASWLHVPSVFTGRYSNYSNL